MSVLSDASVAELRMLIGATETREQELDVASIVRFSVAIGNPGTGGGMPPLGHWAFFHDIVADAMLGPDGHPRRGEFMPAVPTLPRRMFAGARITFAAPLVIGQMARVDLRITDLRHKRGRTGDLVFVDVERCLSQEGLPCLVEVQTFVYMAIAQTTTPLPIPAIAEGEVIAPGHTWIPGAAQLFRFSAATFNGHRIHYDHPYATAIERYPALVVQGPFIAAKLAGIAGARGSLATFEFRANAPGFVDQPIRLVETGSAEFAAIRCDNAVMMTAKATYQ